MSVCNVQTFFCFLTYFEIGGIFHQEGSTIDDFHVGLWASLVLVGSPRVSFIEDTM